MQNFRSCKICSSFRKYLAVTNELMVVFFIQMLELSDCFEQFNLDVYVDDHSVAGW